MSTILVEYVCYSGGLAFMAFHCFMRVFTVMTDKRIICYLDCSDPDVAPERTELFTKIMSDEAYEELEAIIKSQNILDLDPIRGQACDGGHKGWRLYDSDNKLIGEVCEYVPRNETLLKIGELIEQRITDEEYEKIWKIINSYTDIWVEKDELRMITDSYDFSKRKPKLPPCM